MSLIQHGELLSVTSEVVTPGPGATWTAFESKKFFLFDGKSGVEVAVGNDFPQDHFLTLKQAADQNERPKVQLEVSIYKGRLYANRVLAVDDELLVRNVA